MWKHAKTENDRNRKEERGGEILAWGWKHENQAVSARYETGAGQSPKAIRRWNLVWKIRKVEFHRVNIKYGKEREELGLENWTAKEEFVLNRNNRIGGSILSKAREIEGSKGDGEFGGNWK